MSVTQLRAGTRTARKRHRCQLCNVAIEPGTKHHVSTNVFDGRVYDWRECSACVADFILSEVDYWAGNPEEGVGYDSAVEWAHDHRDDSLSGPAARRWLERAGCRCERCSP